MSLNEIELDFVEFLAERRSRSREEIETTFLRLRNRYKFIGPGFDQLAGHIHRLHTLLYDDKEEAETIRSYQFHEFLHTLVYLSYSYPKAFTSNFKEAVKFIRQGDWSSLVFFTKRKLTRQLKKDPASKILPRADLAHMLVEKINGKPVVVDYGCGLAYISLTLARHRPDAKIYLVDIDCLHLDFTVFRFRKYGFDPEVIRVTPENLYPDVPKHNICIVTEVMEHVFQPLKLYQNIRDAMEPGGILHGSFRDHEAGLFHVFPDLRILREKVQEDFDQLDLLTYQKKRNDR